MKRPRRDDGPLAVPASPRHYKVPQQPPMRMSLEQRKAAMDRAQKRADREGIKLTEALRQEGVI